MTKTTEELKREMYRALADFKCRKCVAGVIVPTFDELDSALEAYLEALHKDASAESARLTETIRYSAVLSDAYAHQQQLTRAACVSERKAWDEVYELKGQVRDANDSGFSVLMDVRAERDELRNKLQAFEFANKSAGELLRDALATVKRQREYIRTLYVSRKARKNKGSTLAQSSTANAPELKSDAVPLRNYMGTIDINTQVIVHKLEFDDFHRISCSACKQQTDVPK
jgi:hypothetical protein